MYRSGCARGALGSAGGLARHDIAPACRLKLADEHFLLATLAERPERLVGLVLERSQYVTTPELADFFARRIAQGEPIDRETFDGHVTVPVAERIDELLANPGVRVPPAFRTAYTSWHAERARRELLESLGRIWPV